MSNFGTLAAAQLMDEDIKSEAKPCQVWKLDIEHYNRTGEVRKLEYLRDEEEIVFKGQFNYRVGERY
ncbi:MAG: hypothetical protein Q8911_08580 [Bacillota bacterium]|nr:hypothetical protein [Bacillota bacterium]